MCSNDIRAVKELADFLEITVKTAYMFASKGMVADFQGGEHMAFMEN